MARRRPPVPSPSRPPRAAIVAQVATLLLALYALTFLIECVQLVWGPARDASMPNLVPERQLGNANSLSLISAYGPLPIAGAVFAILAWVSSSLEAAVPFLGDRKSTRLNSSHRT